MNHMNLDVPGKRLVKGNSELAKALGVSRSTIQDWRKRGYLTYGIYIEIGRIVIYDLDKVLEGLQPKNLYKFGRHSKLTVKSLN